MKIAIINNKIKSCCVEKEGKKFCTVLIKRKFWLFSEKIDIMGITMPKLSNSKKEPIIINKIINNIETLLNPLVIFNIVLIINSLIIDLIINLIINRKICDYIHGKMKINRTKNYDIFQFK